MTMNYVDNKELLALAIDLSARRKIDPNARISERMGGMLLLMAQRLATSREFASQEKIRDDLISEGLVNIVKRAGNFDVEQSKSAFAYFSQMLYFSFIGVLKKERAHTLIKMTAWRNQDAIEGDLTESDRAILCELNKEKTKTSVFLKKGGTLTARRNRFKKLTIDSLYVERLDSLYHMELWF